MSMEEIKEGNTGGWEARNSRLKEEEQAERAKRREGDGSKGGPQGRRTAAGTVGRGRGEDARFRAREMRPDGGRAGEGRREGGAGGNKGQERGRGRRETPRRSAKEGRTAYAPGLWRGRGGGGGAGRGTGERRMRRGREGQTTRIAIDGRERRAPLARPGEGRGGGQKGLCFFVGSRLGQRSKGGRTQMRWAQGAGRARGSKQDLGYEGEGRTHEWEGGHGGGRGLAQGTDEAGKLIAQRGSGG